MQFTIQSGFAVPFTVAPVDSANNPAKAKLSSLTLNSSDTALFSVGFDPSNPLAGTLTANAAGTGTFSLQAVATEPDGTQHPVAGAVTITVTAAPIPVPQATALVVTFGTPVASVPSPPPPPTV